MPYVSCGPFTLVGPFRAGRSSASSAKTGADALSAWTNELENKKKTDTVWRTAAHHGICASTIWDYNIFDANLLPKNEFLTSPIRR
jgi:hypothetical protein